MWLHSRFWGLFIVRRGLALQPLPQPAQASGDTLMPLNKKGEKIKAAMMEEYGPEHGKQVFYASENKGTITGVTREKAKRMGPKRRH